MQSGNAGGGIPWLITTARWKHGGDVSGSLSGRGAITPLARQTRSRVNGGPKLQNTRGTKIMSNIFQHNGAIDTSVDPMTIHPDRRAQYVGLAEAQKECERTETDLKSANDAVAEAVRIHDATQAAIPRTTFLEEWRRSRG
jgi:hypothetical protein